MKRFVLILITILASAFVGAAHPKALGVRVGADCQLSYEHNVRDCADFVELDFGMQFLGLGWNAAGAYNFMVAQPQWTRRGEWGVYIGPALKAGYMWIGGYLSAGFQAGMEYTFSFPLQVSIDIRPAVGVAMEGRYFFIYGAEAVFGSIPCLSLRYRF